MLALDDAALLLSAASRALRRQLRPVAWVTLEEVALGAVFEDGRLVARTSARQVAERLGIDPTTANKALGVLRSHGLLMLEREQGPAGRFGLSVYVLGSVAGLTVMSPCGKQPCVASPSLEMPTVVDSGPVEGDLARPGSDTPGAVKPCAVVSHTVVPGPATDGNAKSARTEKSSSMSLAVPQCPGQTELDFGMGSS